MAAHPIRLYALLSALFTVAWQPVLAQEATGTIKGVVLDQHTLQPVPGANVALLGTPLGAIAGDQGQFTINQAPMGVQRLRVSMIGYSERVRPDVIVQARRITSLTVHLEETPLQMAETTVSADFFSAAEEKAVSAVNLNYEEIRRSPGSAQDLSRLLQALPSVNMNNDQRNDLIVRGGSPAENLVLIDEIEIPNINHFPTQGASGGPIGLLNVELISEADFSAGGFSAAYGDRLSSVMSIKLREGNRDEFDGQADLGMAGAGFVLEGPLGGSNASWLLGARRSYLDLIVDAIGTGAVPKYSDLQGKLSWDLGPDHKLWVLGLGGFDHIAAEPEDSDENDDRFSADYDQYALGAAWRWLWSARGYAIVSLAQTYARFGVEEYEGWTPLLLYTNDSQERTLVLRHQGTYHWRPGHTLIWGLGFKGLFSDLGFYAAADTNRLNTYTPEFRLQQEVRTTKASAFLSSEHLLLRRLRATLGLRYDYLAYNEEHDLAPRLNLSWEMDAATSINTSWGLYYQALPLSLLAQDRGNRRLENLRATHYVLGLNRRLTPSTRLTLEAYLKDYAELPSDPDDPTASAIDAFAGFGSPLPGALVGGGEARSRGAELLIQKKLAQSLYGTFGYSYSISRYTDLLGEERNRDFDNRHLLSAIVGYRPSPTWEFSGRWSFAGGRPYTPFDQELSTATGKGIVQRELLNRRRYPSYHRLDLQLDYRRHFRRCNLVTFFSLLNAYNRANIYTYYWDKSENAQDRIDQWRFLPVGGFELEF